MKYFIEIIYLTPAGDRVFGTFVFTADNEAQALRYAKPRFDKAIKMIGWEGSKFISATVISPTNESAKCISELANLLKTKSEIFN